MPGHARASGRSGRLALRRDGCGRPRRRLRITEVALADGLEVLVKLVQKRDAGRDVELDDLFFADVVQVLDQRAQAVAVRRDQHALTPADGGGDVALPVGQKARDRVLQALGRGDLFGLEVAIARVTPGPERIVLAHGRRGDVVAAAPDLDLLLTMS